jgi:hypothetical protein
VTSESGLLALKGNATGGWNGQLARGGGLKQDFGPDVEDAGQGQHLEIGHPAESALDLGQGLAADVPAGPVDPGGQLRLGQPPLLAKLADDQTDDVAGPAHVRNSERDRCHECCDLRFRRRLGPHLHAKGQLTPALAKCRDVFELESGDFAIVGTDITHAALPGLPPDASWGPDERIVLGPQRILIGAQPDIPDRVWAAFRGVRYNNRIMGEGGRVPNWFGLCAKIIGRLVFTGWSPRIGPRTRRLGNLSRITQASVTSVRRRSAWPSPQRRRGTQAGDKFVRINADSVEHVLKASRTARELGCRHAECGVGEWHREIAFRGGNRSERPRS